MFGCSSHSKEQINPIWNGCNEKADTKNDYARNKDPQDPIAVLKLSDDNLVDQLSKFGYVELTIIPETKYTEKNNWHVYKSYWYFSWSIRVPIHDNLW